MVIKTDGAWCMTVNDLYNAFNNMLSYLNDGGLCLDELTSMKVVSFKKGDPDIDIYFERINDTSDKSIKLFYIYRLPEYPAMFSIIRFSDDGIRIIVDTNIEVDDDDLSQANATMKQYVESINMNIESGIFSEVDNLIYYSVWYEYSEFANPTNEKLLTSLMVPMISAYTMYKPDLIAKYLT